MLIEHYPGLIGLVARRCRSRADAADLLHDAIRISIEHHADGRIADVYRLPGYVFRTALNLLRNHNRAIRNRPECRASESEVESLSCQDGLAELDGDVIVRQVRDALTELRTDRDRQLLQRFYIEDEPKEEICRDLGISAAHFDKIIFRARRRMKEILTAHAGEGEAAYEV
ncbi:sigma-70 family RNA polymerase sigma factor [Povalibacter sp.]|uniref:RNA polymerase sigma factor n=1 Tax=Povalibacter sp. TaxID=1962978 RepID=UPI002F4054D4